MNVVHHFDMVCRATRAGEEGMKGGGGGRGGRGGEGGGDKYLGVNEWGLIYA